MVEDAPLKYDIALLITDDEIEFTDDVQPVCLPSKEFHCICLVFIITQNRSQLFKNEKIIFRFAGERGKLCPVFLFFF